MPRIELDSPSSPPRELPDYPLNFRELQRAWDGFSPEREYHRVSFGEWLEHILPQADVPTLEAALVRPSGQPAAELLQRHFYWSTTCFVRSYHLFLSYLVLDAQGLYSWGIVTGYYSRFYFAKALLNLWLSTWVWVGVGGANAPKRQPYLLYTGTRGARLVQGKAIPPGLRPRESHGSWWALFGQLQHVADFPEEFSYVLSDPTFDQDRRQEVNYSDRWMEGFPELEWFDHTLTQMLAHARGFRGREDRDFTDMDRFFTGYNPEDGDVADFYTDEVQSLWNSMLCYLHILDQLRIEQDFITREKLMVLSERALANVLPMGLEGIRRTLNGNGEA